MADAPNITFTFTPDIRRPVLFLRFTPTRNKQTKGHGSHGVEEKWGCLSSFHPTTQLRAICSAATCAPATINCLRGAGEAWPLMADINLERLGRSVPAGAYRVSALVTRLRDALRATRGNVWLALNIWRWNSVVMFRRMHYIVTCRVFIARPKTAEDNVKW